MSIFSDNLTAKRKKANLTRKEMAEKIGVAMPTYANYENGEREPKLNTLIEIASILNTSIDDLLGFVRISCNDFDYYKNIIEKNTTCKVIEENEHIYIKSFVPLKGSEKEKKGTLAKFENRQEFILKIGSYINHCTKQYKKDFELFILPTLIDNFLLSFQAFTFEFNFDNNDKDK